MRFVPFVLTVALAATLNVSCTTPLARALPMNSDLILSDAKVVALKKEAFAGDGDAAYALFIHYSWGRRDDALGEPWLRFADRLGSQRAKMYLHQWRIAQPSDYARFRTEKQLPRRGDFRA